MKEFGMIRHGEKLGVGESRKSLEKSGLSPEQQEKWKEAAARLRLKDPEISYAALPKIERMAQRMYDELPQEALVVFATTQLPRARMTADLLANELSRLTQQHGKKIHTAFIWEPPKDAQNPESVSHVSMFSQEFNDRFARYVAMNAHDDETLADYLDSGDSPGGRFHPKEDELVLGISNEDLASGDSVLRRRAELLKKQFSKIEKTFQDSDAPVYFFAVGHHSSLIALDVAFNGRERYESVDEIPEPLSLWKANLGKETNDENKS